LVTERKKKKGKKIRYDMGKGSVKTDEAEACNK
jgi:hypothetical protein